jgi:hypothetical protein
MPSIRCNRMLWTRLRDVAARPHACAPDGIFHGVALGSWTAKMFNADGRDLVIALDGYSNAIVLFPLRPRRRFRASFAAALAALLEDLDVAPSVIAQECAAISFATMCSLDTAVPATLSHAQYLCELDLVDGLDLRGAQLHVNEYPHPGGPARCAIEALAELFAPALARKLSS